MGNFLRNKPLNIITIFSICFFIENSYGENIKDSTKLYAPMFLSDTDKKIYSYGKWEQSIMFSSADIIKMKQVIEAYEGNNKQYINDLLIPTKALEGEIKETRITSYPNFHLHSIAFHSHKDWSVWVNDIKITNKNNTKNKYELKVTSISKNGASFSWKAKEKDYMGLFIAHHIKLKDSKEKTDDILRNRFVNSNRKGHININSLEVYFSLRQNQSISGKTLQIFEGLPKNILTTSLKEPFSGISEAEEIETGDIPDNSLHGSAVTKDPISSTIEKKHNPKSQMMQTLGIE